MLYPLITIGVTSYNAGDTILRSLNSAINQNYPDFEIVVADDCSQDHSTSLINSIIAETSNIRLIVHTENLGVAAARNTIIENAKGEFTAFFDDDDHSVPERLLIQYDRIHHYEQQYETDQIICHSARLQTYPNNYQRYEKALGTVKGPAPAGRAVAERILIGKLNGHGKNIAGSCATCSCMARTKIFRDSGGFDTHFRRMEDTDFSIRFALKGGHFIGVSEPLVHQTMTSGEEKLLNAQYHAECSLILKHKAFLSDIGWFDFCRRWIEVRYENFHGRKVSMIRKWLRLAVGFPIKSVQKIVWSRYGRGTRHAYIDWHCGKLG